ncbi:MULTISPECIES: caspase family protein [unclassified Streptomyces]|uniref:HD domain-containing protein n=1 Tax=unclassified Streptomyces TaxID=2593676 RepID=UPI002E81C816|nr:caspase family protein [Streptomyces sp. NBC_00589]WTI38299.1 caspase family protein [Streptomyces sp. NBC_00775]WUB28022.1 caspase family protein [Streptomyces sp. NBC_00589]
MARYKALLIGVAQYEAPGISPLPFVHDDLDRMATALSARGFHQVHLAQAQWFTPNVINGEVTGFLASAEPGDRLLVVMSGHGVHSEGRDYLVPEDIRPELSPFTGGCVEIDWRDELESTRASQVVFLIDACREGIRNDTMSTSAWSIRKVAAALRRKAAYVYACSQAEVARYVRDTDTVRAGHDVGTKPADTFSLFSRTVTDLLAGPVSTLREFKPAAQERIDALHKAYGKPGVPQHVRVLTEDDHDDFTVFPPAETTTGLSGAERTWAETVMAHPAWKLTSPARAASVDSLKEVCGLLAGRYGRACAAAEPKIADDPWYDRELADRTTERVGFLLLRLPEETELSPTEAALLAVLPFATQAHWAQQAARRELPDTELNDFLKSFPRLGRRLRTLEQKPSQALSDIRWWGFHRWLVRQPEAFTPRFLTCDSLEIPAAAPAWVRSELSATRLLSYLKEQRVAPSAIPGSTRSTALQEEREVAPSTSHEHTVRERLVSALLKAAHALAIDPADLPEVLVEHLGISDSVSMEDLRATLRQSHWVPAGAGRSLNALCGHPAIELALKRHGETVDVLLRDINKEAAKRGSSLAPLASLPAYADGQQVRPSGAAPAELSSGIRFRLADDRVQELLMGEQLYGDRALAIRELYQNALDALRYRTARTEYLRRTGVQVLPWKGEIVFSEGTDDRGLPYLECADNGIGMGVTELSRAFAQGGSRFVDLPEYLEEGAQWASLDPPVELVPVSRFGLGVLSYFMIADELSVLTCRLDREGRPGRLLKVTIAGPGNLFRVEDLGPGREAGTKVRLHGAPERPMPSSGEELGKHLWVSPYEVRAPVGKEVRRWEAKKLVVEAKAGGEFSSSAYPRDLGTRLPSGKSTPYVWAWELNHQAGRHSVSGGPSRPSSAVACQQDGVWWTDGNGALLVDGIANDTTRFGRVVDLHGAEQATLSVDRKKLSWYDEQLVHDQCVAAIDDLIDAPGLLSPAWLDVLHAQDSELAESIAIRAAEKEISWRSYDWTLDVGRTGFFPPDLLLLPTVTGSFPWPRGSHDTVAALMILCMPEPVLRWRLRALHPDLPADSLPAARPSDLPLLSFGGQRTWAQVLQQATASYTEAHELGDASRDQSAQRDDELRELDQLTALPRWRPAQFTVSWAELLVTAAHLWRAPGQVAERLSQLGYNVADLGSLATTSADDLPLLVLGRSPLASFLGLRHASSEELLPPGACIPLAHLYAQDHPLEAARRLKELGYVLPSRAFDHLVGRSGTNKPDQGIAKALLQHPDGLSTLAAETDRVSRGQLLFTAARMRSRPETVAKRLTELGFVVPDLTELPELTAAHHAVAAVGLRIRRINTGDSVSAVTAFRMAAENQEPIQTALADFGIQTDQSPVHHAPAAIPTNADADADWTASATQLPLIAPTYLRVAATLTNGSVETLKDVYRASGYTADFPEDPAHDQLLIRAFQAPDSLDPHPGQGRHATLAEITSAALMLRRPFREVAAKATELGFHHEAENWFDANP